jgi:tryptophan synthase alpha chain
MPYYTLGYPDLERSLAIVAAIAADSDLLELGLPFSDPLADGPTIQRSAQRALAAGATTVRCLALARQLRQMGVQTPALLMGYLNPILAYGLERFVQDAASAGIDGFIIPDLPPEEAAELEAAAVDAGLALAHLLAPTSSDDRIRLVTARSSGFVYLVAVTGVTGARQALAGGLADFVARVRLRTEMPLAVGFGISTPAQAREVAQMADGVIVGSALINAVDAAANDSIAAATTFVRGLAEAIGRPLTGQ